MFDYLIFIQGVYFLIMKVLVENTFVDNRYAGEKKIVEWNKPIIENSLSRILAVVCEIPLRDCKYDVFIEEIEDHFCNAGVIPMPMKE